MTYTLAGTATDASSTSTSTVAFNIGAIASPFVIVGIGIQNGGLSGATLTVGGISLNLDITDSPNSYMAIFSGKATGLSGSQNFALTVSGSGFETRSFAVWYTSSNITGVNQTASIESSTPLPISVTNGDYMFAMAISGMTDFNNSDVPPNSNNIITGGWDNPLAGDWLIAATNATFHIRAEISGTSANFYAAAATYSPMSAPTITTIGIGGSEW